ncbi:MAG TPA: RNA polymerase sigma factor [Opitutaceae bacterium]
MGRTMPAVGPATEGIHPVLPPIQQRMVTDDERILIARSKAGDLEAFAELVRTHQRMIYSLAYRMSGSAAAAEDLAQETFILAHTKLAAFRGDSKCSSWLYRIAINLCLRWRKSEQRRGLADGEWALEQAPSDSGENTGARVQEALARLSPKLRAAVILTAYDGLTHAEAASVLGCAEKTLSGRLFSARRQLAEILRVSNA